MVAIFAISLMIAVDQLVKYWAFTSLQAIGTIPLIPDIFHLTYVENRGAAFSIMQGKIWILVILTVAVLIAIVYAVRRDMIRTTLGKWSLYIIAGGAIGNLLDRMFRGFVVDLFDFRLINFPVFNVADIFVCVGGLLFAVYVIFQHDKAAEQKP